MTILSSKYVEFVSRSSCICVGVLRSSFSDFRAIYVMGAVATRVK